MNKYFAFVLMPFSSEFDDIYALGIKAACQELDIECQRVDEQLFDESILERIYNQIEDADIIIADMSHKNPNVFYEAGYAHGRGQRVILLTKNSEDIPFDLRHYQHIVYGDKISVLKDKLKAKLKWAIENQKGVGTFIYDAEETSLTYREAKRYFERAYIVAALNQNDWNLTKTAMALQLDRSHLRNKIMELGIKRENADNERSK